MNLEVLALRRAEEQMQRVDFSVPEVTVRKARKYVPGRFTSRYTKPITCHCGACAKCRNREWMRQRRAGSLPPVPECAQCGAPMRRHSLWGWCQKCRNRLHRRFAKYQQQFFSHGGGI